MIIRHIYIIILLVFTSQLFGQNTTSIDGSIQTDTIKKINTLLVPIIFYSPESNFAFGGGGQVFFKTKNTTLNALNSSILVSAIYTLNKQFMFEATPQMYFKNENYFLDAKFRYKIFPNQFWGIGQNTPDSAQESYNQTEISLTSAFLKQLPNNVNFGFEFNFANYIVTETKSDGLLESGIIEGSSGATLIGLGFVLNVDNRDNKFSPLHGGFYQYKTNFTSRAMGSTHSFNTYHIDLRKYVNIFNNHVIAMQLFSRLTYGNSPFQAKSYYGGAAVSRGFFRGRYIDDNLYVVQVEYRLPIGRRWELATFMLTGNVGNTTPDNKMFKDFKSSIGFGPRYFIYKDKRILLRLDIGFNNEGGNGIYFGINEAF